MVHFSTLFAASLAVSAVSAAPLAKRASFTLSNGQAAQALNAQFATLTASSSCTAGQEACVNGQFAQCVGSTFESTACAAGTQCFALPLVNSAGTSITCATEDDAVTRIAATGATGGLTGSAAAAASAAAAPSVAPVASSAAPVATPEAVSSAAPIASPVASAAPVAGNPSFALSNGQEAQSLNAQFATLTASSPCTAGQQACVNGDFAQCVGSTFESTACSAGTQCFALPLVNSAGTSITCATEDDAVTRIAATGATGGLTGSDAAAAAPSVAASPVASVSSLVAPVASPAAVSSAIPVASPAAAAPVAGNPSFALSNGQEAQSLNAQFATLTASSSCTTGQQACVAGAFAQCVGSTFESTACAAGTQCFALPLVNSAGTSITCATEDDAVTRIAATGATGGLTGSD